jgi:hypothetical protein
MNLMSLFEPLLHWFTPRESNAHHSKLLHNRTLAYLVLLLTVVQVGLVTLPRVSPRILGFAAEIQPQRIIDLTNQQRASQGLAPLSLNSELSQAALSKAGYMFAKDYWAHVAPDGTQPWTFITQSGYHWSYAGENLARDFTNPDAVVLAWMNSSSHRENILNPKYQDIGVAVVDGTLGGVETTLVVQMFGTRIGTVPAPPTIAVVTVPSPLPTMRVVAGQPVNSSPGQTPMPVVVLTTPVAIAGARLPIVPTTPPLAAGSLTQVVGDFQPLIHPYTITRTLGTTLFSILIVALTIDMLLVWRRRIIRLSGRSWAHITFLITMFLALFLIRGGNIL